MIDSYYKEAALQGGMQEMQTVLALEGISKSFAGVNALKDVSFDVRAGEVHALLGENGAGKSTLIKVAARVGSLSVANRQRVEIAKALSQDAHVLIMDEPTASLADADVRRLMDVVRRLRERSVGIVYISHRMSEVFALADRVTVLRDG